jgi:hypothetical protein
MNSLISSQLDQKTESWFSDFISTINTDLLQLETNTAPSDKVKFYRKLANSSGDDLAYLSRVTSTTYFIKNLVIDYITGINDDNISPVKIALDLSEAKVLIWAEIKDDDEETEDKLRLLEAKINAKYSQFGFNLTSTIVEESDYLSVPNHYQSLIKTK